jgi:hypothetical protein
MTVQSSQDRLSLELKSFGFDKYQTQFLDARVFSRHSADLVAIYDRARYNLKTLGLNDNIDIDLTLSVNEHGVKEAAKVLCDENLVGSLNTINTPSTYIEVFTGKDMAHKIANVLSKAGSNPCYGNNTTFIDLQAVKKFFVDFVIDMDQFGGVTWGIAPSGIGLSIDMIYQGQVVMNLHIGTPNWKHHMATIEAEAA